MLLIAAAVAALAACSKDDPAPAPTAATLAPAPSAPPSAIAVAAVSASVSPSASVAPSAVASVAPGPSGSAKAAATCGDKPLPPCPLAKWMKANTSAAMSAQDFDALATALDKVPSFAPTGYTNWVSISRDGADAARAQSLDGVKASCRGCHNQYKDRYKKEMRDRPI
jgi:hypothetical protein